MALCRGRGGGPAPPRARQCGGVPRAGAAALIRWPLPPRNTWSQPPPLSYAVLMLCYATPCAPPYATAQVEKNMKDWAAGVEALVDKVVSGEAGLELIDNMDK